MLILLRAPYHFVNSINHTHILVSIMCTHVLQVQKSSASCRGGGAHYINNKDFGVGCRLTWTTLILIASNECGL